MAGEQVSLVIPGRNCAATLRPCLDAVLPILESQDSPLAEIIFVNDGSTDATADVVAEFPVSCLPGRGDGPGAARNLGWRAARYPLVWFIDSDCVSQPDALDVLLPHLDDPHVAGVGGSYGNMCPDSLLACLIHEEIVQRHQAMPARVNFLATFNVLYRRQVLQDVSGFDERFLKGQDAELSWRILEAGHALAFDINSRVAHYHPTSWLSYFRTQRQQGYWRVKLHLSHSGHSAGDSYSSAVDHLQPPLAMLVLASLPLTLWPYVRWIPAALAFLLAAAQIPLTWRLVRRKRQARYLAFAVMSLLRSFWRGVGMTGGILAIMRRRRRSKSE